MANSDFERYGYHWTKADRSMIHFSSPEIPSLSLYGSTKVQRYPMGMLDRLPLEIIHQILEQLDFFTLVILRGLNLASRSIVDSLPAFKYMTQYAANTLRALSRTRLITVFTASRLLNVLRTDRCMNCQQYGAFLFLLTCSRCCFKCLEKDARLRAITLSTAKSSLGLKAKDLRRLPTMLSLPGTYALRGRRTTKKRFRLVSAVEAFVLAKALYGDATTALTADSAQLATEVNVREQAWASMLASFVDPFRGFASTAFPSLDTGSMCVQSGISCRGCEDACNRKSRGELKGVNGSDLIAQRDMAFSLIEFRQHLRQCEGIKRLRHLCLGGEKKAADYLSRLAFFGGRGLSSLRSAPRTSTT